MVPNIRVRADGANPVASDSEGQFALVFPFGKPGDLVEIDIARAGWAVVNDIQLERIIGRLHAVDKIVGGEAGRRS